MAKAKAGEDEEQRKARQRREVLNYENANDLVPGTAHHLGDGKHGGPAGGIPWEGKARSALARQAAGVALNHVDREAIDRYPNPRSPWPAQ